MLLPLTCIECSVKFEFVVSHYGFKEEYYCLSCGNPVCEDCKLEYKNSDWKSWLEISFRCSKCFREYLTKRGLTQQQINLLEGPKDFNRATYLTNLGHTPEIFNTPRLEDFDLASFPRRITMTYENDEAGHYLVWEEGDKAVIIKWEEESSACGLSFKNGVIWRPVGQHHNIDWQFASLELTLASLKDAGWQITIQGLPKDRPRYTDSLAKEFGYTEIVYPAPGTRSSEEFRKPPLRFRDKIDWLNTH